MDKIQAMFQKIINGQSAMKSELLMEIRKVNKKVDDLEIGMKKGFRQVDGQLAELTKRVDNIGLAMARLEDDTPTIEEFEKLEKRIENVEQKVAAI